MSTLSQRLIFFAHFAAADALACAASAMCAPIWAFGNNQIFTVKRVPVFAVGAFRKMCERSSSSAVFVPSDCLKMGWVDAAFGFAKMIYLQLFGNWTVNEFPGKSTGISGVSVPPKSGVSIFVASCFPDPAFATIVNFFSKTFGIRLKGGCHGYLG
jgi:hypothetical protein